MRVPYEDLVFGLWDPDNTLPENMKYDPEIYFEEGMTVYVPFELFFKTDDDKFKALVNTKKNYVYCKYDPAVLSPVKVDGLDSFIQYLSSAGVNVVINVIDSNLPASAENVVADLVKSKFHTFRLFYSDVKANMLPEIDEDDMAFSKEQLLNNLNVESYVAIVPVNVGGGQTVNYIAYSVAHKDSPQ